MIKRLSRIKNLGQFENFESHQEFEKNSILFGFNGAALATVLTELITLIYVVICMREDHYFSVNHKNVFSVEKTNRAGIIKKS